MKVTVPPSPVDERRSGGTARCAAGRRRPAASSAPRARRASRPGRRPRSARSARSGTRAARAGGVEQAVGVGVLLDQPDPARRAARARSSAPKMTSSRRRRGVHQHDVGAARPRRLRSMPITGVMPLPAVMNSTLSGPRSGRTKSPAAWSSWTSVPGLRAVHQVVADLAVGDRLDGDGDAAVGPVEGRGDRVGPPLADAVDVDADAGRTGPGRWPRQPRPGRITRVAASPVSGRTASIRPRRSAPAAQRVDQVEVVGGQQRRGESSTQPSTRSRERRSGWAVADAERSWS